MHPHDKQNDVPAILATEVVEITNMLGSVLDEAGIKLPQLHSRLEPGTGGDWLVRLGDCNVLVGLSLANLLRDGLILREKHPEESTNAGT
jgi:excinuclease UvrABC helicase subunit UvrB